jgi:mono/diheme cytochrome c family protein
MKNVALTLVGVVAVGIVAALIFVYSGAYNVAASKENGAAKEWLLETTMENSVAARADEIEVPDLSAEERLPSGASHYDSMCVACHGAPGRERAEFAAHLNPEPPDFGAEPEEIEEWSAAQMFWITKHGIEMTGMPAWGPTHSDEELWNMVALMKKFPEMSVGEYDALLEQAQESGHHHGGGGGHDHGGDHHEANPDTRPDGASGETKKADDATAQEQASPQDDGGADEQQHDHDHSEHAH